MKLADLPLTLDQGAGDKLILEFTKERFSDFIFSLLSTPRAETRVYKGGFDIDLDEIGIIIEKIKHKITTAYDVLNLSFSAEVILNSDTQISYQSIDQLLSVDDPRSEEVKEISITLAPVIAFNRPEGKKSYEKQTINVSFRAGAVGEIQTRIESTEISWPAGFFSLLDEQYKKLSNNVKRNRNRFVEDIFFVKKVFSFVDIPKLQNMFYFLFPVFLLSITIFSLSFEISNEKTRSHIYLYNEETKLIERLKPSHIEEAEPIELAALITIAEGVRNAVRVDKSDPTLVYKTGSEPKSAFSYAIEIISNKYALGFGILSALFVYGNWYIARDIARDRIGRLFIQKGSKPPRPHLETWEGVLGSIVLGILASILASAVLTLL